MCWPCPRQPPLAIRLTCRCLVYLKASTVDQASQNRALLRRRLACLLISAALLR